MKAISISVLGTSGAIVFLLSPGTTVGQVLDQLKVKDYVLYPVADPARLFDHKTTLHDQVKNGDRLIAAGLPEAAKAYRRSRLYH